MLEPNRLNPPQPYREPITAQPTPTLCRTVFVSADDFDGTGVLSGCDPCASSYWWMPELHGAPATDLTVTLAPLVNGQAHAARRGFARPQAAA